ncbi:type VII secretion system ESX-2 subunit EccB2 [Streptomonospora sediminis]
MQTRRDRVQAYNFTVGRLGTAMLEADPDAVDQPMRRTRTGTFIGLAIGALIAIGFLVFGLIFPGGSTSWRQDGQLVIAKDTGTTYLYGGGELRPVANYTSARLASGGEPNVSKVAADSISGARVGSPIGIPAAPEALPSADAAANVWRLCALPGDGQGRSALTVGPDPGPGTPLDKRGVLVVGPEGDQHLLWQGRRLRLDVEGGALQALGYGNVPASPVPEEFLEAVPAGPDLTAPDVAGAGEQGPAIAGAPSRVGQVFAVPAPGGNGADQHYLLTADGLVPLTQTDALLLLADPDIQETAYPGGSATAVEVPAGEANAHLSPDARPTETGDGAAPATPPEAVPLDDTVAPCLVPSSGGGLSLAVFPTGSIDAWKVPETTGVAPGCPTPDRIGIPMGAGGVAAASPVGGTANGSAMYLVTETPAKYRVPDEEALKALGYQASDAAQVPTPLLRLLPTGPELSPQAAARPVAAAGTGSASGGAGQCP